MSKPSAIFADYAPKFHEHGYSVIPVSGKRPVISAWDVFKERSPTEYEMLGWCSTYPDANIGFPLGPYNGLVALDIDFSELFEHEENHPIIRDWAARILSLIPQTPLVRYGLKPFAALFRYSQQRNGPFSINGIKVGELISQGQIVIPPSIHPDSGLAYHWLSDTGLMTYERSELMEMVPEFTDLDFAKLKGELEVFIRPELVPVLPMPRAGTGSSVGGRNDHLKAVGLACLGKGKSVEETASELLKEDFKRHATPLFTDKTDTFRNVSSPEEAALKMARSLDKFVAKQKALALVTPKKRHYPSLSSGFHTYDPDTEKSTPEFDECADYLRFECGLKVKQGYAYLYADTHYVHVTDDELRQKIDQLLQRNYHPKVVNAFFQAAVYKCTMPDSYFVTPEGYLNCANGILRIQDRVLLPHTKDMHFDYVLPHGFNPDAKCNEWRIFLYYVFQGDMAVMDLAAEIFGYVLEGGNPWLHKAFILYGSGRNGKSTFLEVLRALIGPANCSSVPIQKLNHDFSAVMLDSKMANIVGELSSKDADSDAFKTVVAGEPIIASQKKKPAYSLMPKARFLFAANSFPRFNDATTGTVERLCILPFDRYIADHERDPKMAAKLMLELPGVINWALDGLTRLKERGRLPSVDAVNEKLIEYRVESDSVFAYFDECFEKDMMHDVATGKMVEIDLQSVIRLPHLYDYYSAWCHAEGRHPKKANMFGRTLAPLIRKAMTHHPHLKETRPQRQVTFTGPIHFKGTPSVLVKLPKASITWLKP